MDLVIFSRGDTSFQAECREACTLTHLRHIQGITNIQYIMAPSEGFAAKGAIQAGVTDNFILTRDTTFLTQPFDVTRFHKRMKGSSVRKGPEIQAMAMSIRSLLDGGFPSFDFDLPVPIGLTREMAKQVCDMENLDAYHFRTLYCNMMGGEGERMDDPHIDIWTHFMDPQGPVVSVGATALRHKMCRRWINKLKNEPLPA